MRLHRKRLDALVAAVGSLQAQTIAPHEAIVVVDRNPELLARVAAELPQVTSLENPGQRSLSDARNAGHAVAAGDIVAFLDDDAEAEPNWLALLVKGYENPAVVGLGGLRGTRAGQRSANLVPTRVRLGRRV